MPWLRRKPGYQQAGGDYLFLDESWEYYDYHLKSGQFEVVTEAEALGQVEPAPTPPPVVEPPTPGVCEHCGLPGGAHTLDCLSATPQAEPVEPPDTTGTPRTTPARRGRPAASSANATKKR